jgi:hypothetical protein
VKANGKIGSNGVYVSEKVEKCFETGLCDGKYTKNAE